MLGRREICVDMGGFAFDANLLRRLNRTAQPWSYGGRQECRRSVSGVPLNASECRTNWRGGESEFIESLLPNGFYEDLQPLGNCGHDVLVWHNGLQTQRGARDSAQLYSRREAAADFRRASRVF